MDSPLTEDQLKTAYEVEDMLMDNIEIGQEDKSKLFQNSLTFNS